MSILAYDLLDRVTEIITRYNMLSAGGRVGVAVSGGADSVVLLHIFHRLAAQLEVRPVVLHVNHHLRGEESDGDEDFVRSMASKLGLQIVVEQARPGAGNLEQEARDLRREFFRRLIHEEHSVERVALGHTRSDQAETVLFRLIRGTGLRGLAGMQTKTPEGLIRPLLHCSREEVRQWAEKEGIEWREDSSNTDVKFTRNRIRHEIMPELARHFNSNVELALAGTASLAEAEEDFWENEIEPIYAELTKRIHLGLLIALAGLKRLHLAVQRRVIRRAVTELRGNPRGLEMSHIEAILNLCRSDQGHDRVLVPELDALRSFDQLLLSRPGTLGGEQRGYRFNLLLGECRELPFSAGFISVQSLNSEQQICANFKEDQELLSEVVDLDGRQIADTSQLGSLAVRNWEPGDQLHRPGHQGAEKIKSLFQEYRVPLWQRRHWPVLVFENEIVWARRFGCAQRFQSPENNGSIVRVLFRSVE